MSFLPDHGLPLIQLKEQRRELVVALQRRIGQSVAGSSCRSQPFSKQYRPLIK